MLFKKLISFARLRLVRCRFYTGVNSPSRGVLRVDSAFNGSTNSLCFWNFHSRLSKGKTKWRKAEKTDQAQGPKLLLLFFKKLLFLEVST